MNVLGIETSCDDTAVAVLNGRRVLAERAITQEAHRRYLGVVPELASREHLELLFPLLEETLSEAGITLRDLTGIAVTCGPGLVGCLLVGLSTAKALSYALEIPYVGVNHIHAHLMSVFLEREVPFPFLGMVVSGGHTEIYFVENHRTMTPLGSTRDDAAGEAFDKVAKLLGLGYPGGARIDRLAAQGDPGFASFPRPMLEPESLDVSFSGLKTAVRNFVGAHNGARDERLLADIAASFQAAVVDVLVAKLDRALARHPVTTLVVAGGVAANSELRRRMGALASQRSVTVHVPPLRYCGDNAAMVALLGGRLLADGYASSLDLNAFASLEAMAEAEPIHRRAPSGSGTDRSCARASGSPRRSG